MPIFKKYYIYNIIIYLYIEVSRRRRGCGRPRAAPRFPSSPEMCKKIEKYYKQYIHLHYVSNSFLGIKTAARMWRASYQHAAFIKCCNNNTTIFYFIFILFYFIITQNSYNTKTPAGKSRVLISCKEFERKMQHN